MNDTTTEAKEIISPEGVEERVEREETFRITLTGGGKFRLYHIVDDSEPIDCRVFGTKDEAEKAMGKLTAMRGAMIFDPDGFIKMMLRDLDKKEG